MILNTIIQGTSILEKLNNLKLSVKSAYKVYSLTKQINEYKSFFINEERKIIEKFNAQVDGQGLVSFEKEEDKTLFIQEYEQLFQYEINDIQMIELSFKEIEELELTPAEIGVLSNFISFID